MDIGLIFIILGIVIIIFSSKIDEAAKANSKVKKMLIALSIIIFLVGIYILLTIYR